MKKKVLIVTYYWPPSGGAGVQRWVKLSKYLTRLGVECHVLTVDEKKASYQDWDESLVKDIEKGVIVYKTDSFEPVNIYTKMGGKGEVQQMVTGKESLKTKLVKAVRANFFIPDPRIGWNKYAIAKAKEIIKQENIDTLITTSPPHSTQLIGLALKKEFDLKWIVDLRDPWTDIYYYDSLGHSKFSHRKNVILEKQVLESADELVTVSEGCREIFASKTMQAKSKNVHVISNGYDHEDFEGLVKVRSEKFTITYTGKISTQYQPTNLFEAIAKLEKKIQEQIQIKFVGGVSEDIVNEMQKRNLGFEIVQQVPHSEIPQIQKDADLLLLVIPKTENDKGIVTGKIFEYLASGNQIIGIGPADGDAAHILARSESGVMFERGQVNKMSNYIKSLIQTRETNETEVGNVARYSRKAQAESFLKLIA